MKRKSKTKSKALKAAVQPTRDELVMNQVATEAAKASEFELTVFVGGITITVKATA